MANYYPIMLDLRGREVVVIGGNRMAAEKVAGLISSGAHITVIHTTFCADLRERAERGEITLRRKAYEPGDLAGAFVVFAAVTDPELIAAIESETQERGQLLNIVDVPAHCNFIVPSILRRGQLTIAVSTAGASPSLAKRIRQRLEGIFPSTYDQYIRLAAVARAHTRQRGLTYDQRDQFFGDFFTADISLLLEEGDQHGAASITSELLAQHGVEVSAEQILQALHQESPAQSALAVI
jgi:precorrin-2 dehydrogenase/sirohydrochlorin ferrochelatase